jgi:nucleoid-associated protein EbfC
VFKGLGNLANLGSLLKQAQQMAGQMQQLGDELRKRRVEGTAGAGMVTVEVNGLGEVLRCRIDASVFNGNDRELVEDLIPAAVNQAVTKAKEVQAETLKSLGDVPGLGVLLAQLSGGNPGDAAT